MRTPGTRTMAWLGLPAAALLAGGWGWPWRPGAPATRPRPGSTLPLRSPQAGTSAAHRAAGGPGCATPTPVPTRAATPVPVPSGAMTPAPAGPSPTPTARQPSPSPSPTWPDCTPSPGPARVSSPVPVPSRTGARTPTPVRTRVSTGVVLFDAHPGTGAVRRAHPEAGADETGRPCPCPRSRLPRRRCRAAERGTQQPGAVARRCPGRDARDALGASTLAWPAPGRRRGRTRGRYPVVAAS